MSPAIRRSDELAQMYQWMRPRTAMPVHGEMRHLLAQARLAEQCQVPQTIVTRNGEMIKLAPGPAAPIGEVETGRLVVDGTQLIAASSDAIKSRFRMVFNGTALATLVMDKDGKLKAPPQVTVHGLDDEKASAHGGLAGHIAEAIEELSPRKSATTMPCAKRRASRFAAP